MKVSFEASFARDLKRIRDRRLLQRIQQVIEEIKTAPGLSEVKHLEKLKGYETFYRIRVGDYRIGVEIVEDAVIVTRILHRKDLYRYFP